MRQLFYMLARLLGDINAYSKGKGMQRALRKRAHTRSGGSINKWLR